MHRSVVSFLELSKNCPTQKNDNFFLAKCINAIFAIATSVKTIKTVPGKNQKCLDYAATLKFLEPNKATVDQFLYG